MANPLIRQSESTTGLSQFERLTQTQIDAAAETLYDFAWNSDPNDPDCYEQTFAAASRAAKDNYREWARAIFRAALEGVPQHTWNSDFPRLSYDT